MSEMTSFIAEHLLSFLEHALVAHEPELQNEFLAEMKMITEKAADWIEGKIADINMSKI